MKLLLENWRNYIQLNEELLLIEGRIDVVKKKYPELAKTFSTTGPSLSPLDIFIEADPSGNQKYLMGLAKLLNNTIINAVRNNYADSHGINPKSLLFAVRTAKSMIRYLEKFHELQPFIRDQDKPFKDINNIKDFNALQAVVSTAERKKQERERIKQMKGGVSQEAREGSRIIEETDDYIMIRPETAHASCFYGKGTKWCISATESTNMYEDYTNQGVAFYFIFFANLPNDHDSKKIALAVDSQGDTELYDAKDKQISSDGLHAALMQNLLNLKKYPLAYESTLPQHAWADIDLSEAEADYEKAMSDLRISEPKVWEFPQEGKANRYKILQDMVREQKNEIMNMAREDAGENPAGPNEEQYLELLESYGFNYIQIELMMPNETGNSQPVWESYMDINLDDIVAASPHGFKWGEDYEEDEWRDELEALTEDALRDNSMYPEQIVAFGPREFKIIFDRDSGNFEEFANFLLDVKYAEAKIADGQFAEALRERLLDAGFIGRSEREERYWPDPEEKEKQLELPLQEIFRRWRKLII
jgi:hypothetical protein